MPVDHRHKQGASTGISKEPQKEGREFRAHIHPQFRRSEASDKMPAQGIPEPQRNNNQAPQTRGLGDNGDRIDAYSLIMDSDNMHETELIKLWEAEENHVKVYDVGALVFMAKVIVWEYPGFSVNTHLDKLFECQRELEENGFLEATGHRFLIVARKQ